tara:strand:- start:526 stop:891 length:366 start_codon:yes stop_codon:yes gene_type:complete
MIIQVQLSFPDLNVSVQVGDIVYYTAFGANPNVGGFDSANVSNTMLLGEIITINGNLITVEVEDTLTSLPTNDNVFYSFAKNKLVNTSSLLGYYAQVDFVNTSKKKAELFSVGSEIAQSSK